MASIRSKLSLLLVLCCTLSGVASKSDEFMVQIRNPDAPTSLVNSLCFPPCSLDVCEALHLSAEDCPIQAPSGQKRTRDIFQEARSISQLDAQYNNDTHTYLYERAPKPKGEPSGNRWSVEFWTKSRVAQYLPPQILPGESNVFIGDERAPAPEPEFSAGAQYLASPGEERAVAASAVFADSELIQIGSAGLHGCTIVTVVSKKAVWSAHFWEVYSMGYGQIDANPQYDANFKERVLDFINGQALTNPPSNTVPTQAQIDAQMPRGGWPEDDPWRPNVKPYLAPSGPSLASVKANFAAEDEPRAYIMTPYKSDETHPEKSLNIKSMAPDAPAFFNTWLRYPKRIQQIEEALKEQVPGLVVGRGRSTQNVFGYNALNYNVQSQFNQVSTNERGIAMFQRNAKAVGENNDQPAWRLFYQQQMTTGTD